MIAICEKIRQELFALQEREYQIFSSKLIPNIPSELVIGVRVPLLRKLAKEWWKKSPEQVLEFCNALPHTYLEENHLHAFFIEEIKNYEQCIQKVEEFLPYIDNWATCDVFSPKILKKYPVEVYERIKVWLTSTHLYTKRYGIGLLLSNYLEKTFQLEMLERVAKIKTEEYYLQMMIAWYFATALAKQYEETVPYLEKQKLETWVHNKTIQKAIESRRISEEKKFYLKTLKKK